MKIQYIDNSVNVTAVRCAACNFCSRSLGEGGTIPRDSSTSTPWVLDQGASTVSAACPSGVPPVDVTAVRADLGRGGVRGEEEPRRERRRGGAAACPSPSGLSWSAAVLLVSHRGAVKAEDMDSFGSGARLWVFAVIGLLGGSWGGEDDVAVASRPC